MISLCHTIRSADGRGGLGGVECVRIYGLLVSTIKLTLNLNIACLQTECETDDGGLERSSLAGIQGVCWATVLDRKRAKAVQYEAGLPDDRGTIARCREINILQPTCASIRACPHCLRRSLGVIVVAVGPFLHQASGR
jgi:hypothetical protein